MNYVISIPKISYDIAMDTWLMENMDKNSYAWESTVAVNDSAWTLYLEYEVDFVAFKLRWGV